MLREHEMRGQPFWQDQAASREPGSCQASI
jgi:hypothetical protein